MSMSESEDDQDIPLGPQSTHIPATIYVIKFDPNTRKEAIEWLLEKIEAKQKYGGAELFVRCEPQKKDEPVVIHVSATKIKLLEIAESLELQKRSSSGLIQDFSVKDLDHYLFGGITLDTLLTPSEREFCVKHELDSIQARPEEIHLCGYSDIKLFPGQSLIHTYMKQGLITDFFPLHDRSILEDLGNRWYKSLFDGVSMDEIRDYFGESVGMYFSFLSFYASMMVVPAVLAVAHFLFSIEALSEYAFFAAFNIVWVTVLLELWKRRSSELAYGWGTLISNNQPMARSSYDGNMRKNPITGRFEIFSPTWKATCKLCLVSAPAIGICLLVSLWMMVVAFWAEEQLIDWKKQYGPVVGVFFYFPTAIYAAAVWITNHYYKNLACFLTDWENHRTTDDHEWHLMIKLVVFQLMNNFSSLFYIAFYIQDMDMLCSQVATMLIVTQMINHFREGLLPIVVKKGYKQVVNAIYDQIKDHPLVKTVLTKPVRPIHKRYSTSGQLVPVLPLDAKDPRITQAKEEADLDSSLGICENFSDIFVQFGYVFLFSAVYPLASFWVVLNNVLELKRDAFKLCCLVRRPQTKKTAGVGVWMNAFEFIGVLSVVTNCALLSLSPRMKPFASRATQVEWVLIFVGIEHVVLAFKLFLSRCCSEHPEWVKEAVDKVLFQSKAILRNERGKKTRRHLSRRFRSVHGMPRSGSRSRATTPVTQNGSIKQRSNGYRDY